MKEVVDEGRWLATQSSTSEEDLRERFHGELERGHVLVVCLDDGAIVGCAGIHPTPAPRVWGLGTWLLEPYRGRGIGRKLIEAAVAEAVREGARKLELEVFTDNVAAFALYRSAGFEVEGLRRDHYEREDGSIRSATLMALFPAGRETR